VGYGHNLESHGVDPKYAQLIVVDEDKAERLLRDDLEECYALARSSAEWDHFDTIVRRNVFVEMIFNLGYTRLLKFRRMRMAIERHDWEGAAAEMLDSRWATQVGARAKTLASLMERGTY